MKLSELKQLYASGTTVTVLTELSGLPVSEIRYALGLPERQSRFDRSSWPDLYDQGLNDREIADKFGCHTSTVRDWRVENGLEAQNSYTNHDTTGWIDLYDQGLSDGQIGKQVGAIPASVRAWRKRNKLPGKQLKRRVTA